MEKAFEIYHLYHYSLPYFLLCRQKVVSCFTYYFLIISPCHTSLVLPEKAINGLTGEPKEKYYELRGWSARTLSKKKKRG
jgi:hypothetical protein